MPELFLGYTASPRFEAVSSSTDVTATLAADGLLTVQAGSQNALAEVALRVTDVEGSTFERRLCVAVTPYNTPLVNSIGTVGALPRPVTVCYDLFGRRVSSSARGLVIRRTTDAKGNVVVEKLWLTP